LLAGAGSAAKVGYAGIIWPSMRWTDEPIPDFDPQALAPATVDSTAAFDAHAPDGGAPELPRGLDDETRAGLAQVFPGQQDVIEHLAALLEARPDDLSQLAEFFKLVRSVVGQPLDDSDDGEGAGQLPAMLQDDPEAVCRRFAAELEDLGVPRPEDDSTAGLGSAFDRLWNGAREVLRQATYFEMKKRAGTVGRAGLGPMIGLLQREIPGLGVHLIGHSFGARLVSFALAGLPAAASVRSLTLLQGAFSHFAFADALPHDRSRSGALRGMQQRVDGPVVVCFSSHDSAVGKLYPLASFASGDDTAALADRWFRWGAMGHDGAQAVNAASAIIGAASQATRYPFSPGRVTNIDASTVVFRGDPPSGAHSDICHPELAWVVLTAGGIAGGVTAQD
jgi:hypothetical protein